MPPRVPYCERSLNHEDNKINSKVAFSGFQNESCDTDTAVSLQGDDGFPSPKRLKLDFVDM